MPSYVRTVSVFVDNVANPKEPGAPRCASTTATRRSAWIDPRSAQPLTSPRVGMWIVERAWSKQPRQIIDVQCGQRILTLGQRHSIIEWKNLHRYTEWDLQNNCPAA